MTLASTTDTSFSLDIKKSKYSPNQCVLSNDEHGVWLYQANCIEFMDALIEKYPLGMFDMIFADPPYFLSNGGITCQAGKMVKVDKGQWDQSQGAELNHEFNRSWLSRCQKLLNPNGTLWVSGTHHVIHSVGYAMQQLGMKILNDIVWEKPNPPPNLSCRYFTHSTETIIWAAKNEKSKHCFQYNRMKAINANKQMKSVWIFTDSDSDSDSEEKPEEPTMERRWTYTAPSGAEKALGKHPTQKPFRVLERIISASTEEKDWIFDPFAGSATTGVAAVALGRRFVGCELEEDFISLAKKRLDAAILKKASPPGDQP